MLAACHPLRQHVVVEWAEHGQGLGERTAGCWAARSAISTTPVLALGGDLVREPFGSSEPAASPPAPLLWDCTHSCLSAVPQAHLQFRSEQGYRWVSRLRLSTIRVAGSCTRSGLPRAG